jgi:ABC-type branched-subunit amino acid transport system substrate-binding protein
LGTDNADRGVFTGKNEIFELIGALFRRPRFRDPARKLHASTRRWEKIPKRRDRADRKGLPMVNLVRPNGPDDLLAEVRDFLRDARPHGVRHAFVRCDEESATAQRPPKQKWRTEDVTAVRKILFDACAGLLRNAGVRDRRVRFPLFMLVHWLMDQRLDPADQNPDRTLRGRLKEQGLATQINRWSQGVQQELPSGIQWKLPLWLLRAVVGVAFWAAVTGRVRLFSGRFWWYMHQPHLAPEMTSTFARFAGRLVNGEWQKEAQEYVARLLVNAFLEDLRRTYRLRPWNLFRKRRMTYPVLLLDDITPANGGYDLLYLINEVRNQIGIFDPLLVISTSDTVPPDGTEPRPEERPRHSADEAFTAFIAWQDELLGDRRARRDNTWYLPLLVPGPPVAERAHRARNAWQAFSGYVDLGRESTPPALTSVWLRAGVTAAVLAAAALSGLYVHDSRCGSWDSGLTQVGAECIGVTDGSADLFQPSDGPIQQVENTVLTQDQQAATMHDEFPQRPYITIADLQATTSADHTADGLTAERESLEGVAVAQRRQLNKSGSSDPIVRVLIANGGNGMRQGATVARQLGGMTASDPSLVGVVGLDMSSQQTVSTINALADAGLPAVGSALSADSLASTNPMYFQVAPQNEREAAVVSAFARQRIATDPGIAKSLRVYYSTDSADSYSLNLRDDMLAAFAASGFQVSATAFDPSIAYGSADRPRSGDNLIGNAVAAGRDTCGYHGFVFFAGRGVPDYGDFLSGAEQCATSAEFIGDDDVSRYVANAALRGQYSEPYDYVSFAPAPIASPAGAEQDFYRDLRALFPFEAQQAQSRSLDGHAALSYDAALVMITAAEYLREGATSIPVTPGNLWREITDIHSAQTTLPGANKAIDGATGTIDYGGDIGRHVPLNKPVAILRVANGQVDPDMQGYCGVAAGRTSSSWCPPGS